MNPIDRDEKQVRRGEPGEVMVSKQMALGAVVAPVVLAAVFWPADESGRNTSTDASTRVERTPTKPPSSPSTPTSPNQ